MAAMMMPQTPAAASRQPTMMRMTSFRRPLGSVGVWICAVCEDAEEDVWLLVLEDAGALEEERTLDEAGSLDALDALDPVYKRSLYPQSYMVGMERGLARVRDELVRERMAASSSAIPWKRI